MSFEKAYPHGGLEKISDEVYVVRGSIAMNPIVRISRNMVVVNNAGELTLINPVRMNDAGLAQLDALGSVKHLLRLGAFHGVDDPFYVDRYAAGFWSQTGGTTYPEPKIDHELTTGCELPFPGAKFLAFDHSLQPEGVILIETGAGLLVTTDAIQNYGDYSYNNLPARILMPFIGFTKTTLVGPIWLKVMTPQGGSLHEDIATVLELKFDALISAHGTFLANGAHAAVKRAISKAFG